MCIVCRTSYVVPRGAARGHAHLDSQTETVDKTMARLAVKRITVFVVGDFVFQEKVIDTIYLYHGLLKPDLSA